MYKNCYYSIDTTNMFLINLYGLNIIIYCLTFNLLLNTQTTPKLRTNTKNNNSTSS